MKSGSISPGPSSTQAPRWVFIAALCIGGHEDQATRGRRAVRRRRGGEGDARLLDVAAKHRTRRIVPHLADVAGRAAEPGDARHGVGGRAAGDLDRAAHARAERLGALGIDQGHRALGEVFFGEQRVVGLGHDIDDRVADSDDIQP